jgi:hypothetical protein
MVEAADRTYELKDRRTGPLAFASLLSVGFVALGIYEGSVMLVVIMGALAVVVAGMAAYIALQEPRRITLDDDGAVFEARTRRVAIRWVELRAVEFAPWNPYGGKIDWQRVDGRVLRTSAAFSDVHHLLTEVERRAPHVVVST